MNKKNKPFEVPENILNSINEFSTGGFVLFTFDPEGLISIYPKLDSLIHAKAMHGYIKDWTTSIEIINNELMLRSLTQGKKRK